MKYKQQTQDKMVEILKSCQNANTIAGFGFFWRIFETKKIAKGRT